MFNVKHWVEGVLGWLGEGLSPSALSLMSRFADWLRDEAIPAGGLGPAEAQRIEERHLADSLSFAMIVPATATNALDIGSGVGLPGIPLAILRPETEFLLIDRSEKRCDLASRAINVVGLSNVTVQQRDVTEQQGEYDAMTMRAALKQAAALPHIARLMSPRGVAAVGLRRTRSDPTDLVDLADLADLYNLDLELVPVPVLDSPATLLRMTRRDPII